MFNHIACRPLLTGLLRNQLLKEYIMIITGDGIRCMFDYMKESHIQ